MIMEKENLQNYESLTIVCNNATIVARLQHSVTEHMYIAMMPPSSTVGTVQAEQIKLTDDMIGRISANQDGTIQLVL